ncbi:hypothetical protein [Bradyrhizobium yuanmingense]|uniref:hypothetical protein n=1 Tax=Bradyrhizobium yuanmingense TaxID=108015 RepID=UPI0023B8A4E8|nr:hypothetical protein [Bradyrhizobium yuanmingense]MDF0582022.1 hypothetical protein [Bradyrhizobium yuanmingense]
MKKPVAAPLVLSTTLASAVGAKSAQPSIKLRGNDNRQSRETEILSREFDPVRGDVVAEYRQIPFSNLNGKCVGAFAANSAADVSMISTTDAHFYVASGALPTSFDAATDRGL